MLKYVIIIILILIGGLLFINKDKFLSLSATGNEAAVVNSVIGSGGGCPKYFNLRATRLLSIGSKPKETGDPVIIATFKGSGTVTGAGKYCKGTTAVLTAKPDKDSKVIWSGMCSGSGNTCKVLMNSDKEVNYAFAPNGNKVRDIFKNCSFIPYYNPVTKKTEITMNCSW